MMNPVCIVHMLYCSLRPLRGPQRVFTCFTCSSHNIVMSELMSLGRDTGTAEGEIEWRHLNQVTWPPPPPWLYQRMVGPFLFTGGSHQHTTHYKTTSSPMANTHKRTCFAPSEPPEKTKRGDDGTLVEEIKVCFSISF